MWIGSEGAIHIYNTNGTFLKSIDIGENVVTKIVRSNDNVWIGFEDGKIQIYDLMVFFLIFLFKLNFFL